MIPQRVYLRGLLSYRDEQEITFDGSSLWVLSGLNGSGKSTVFDAVTYALFGHHRGGSQRAHELINKDSKGATVEFDFTQDGQLFRARRTLQRNARGSATGSQQILSWQPATSDGDGQWVAIEDTSRRGEFDQWVAEHVGLNYETFTSSVLLLQGKAEKLLDSTAKGRFEVLAGIVDLERYQRLHEKADGQRKSQKGRLEVLRNQLAALPEIRELELVAAENRIAEAEEARRQAQAEVEHCRVLEFQAQRWTDLQLKLMGLRQRWQQAQALVAEGPAIEKDAARLGELRTVLPHLETVLKQRCQAVEAEGRAAQLTRERQELDTRLSERTQAIEQLRQKRETTRQNLAADESRLPKLVAELRHLEIVQTRARECERQRQVLAQQEEELARLPADLVPALERAQQFHDELADLARALPLLERLFNQREGLRQALAMETDQTKEEADIKARGEKLKKKFDSMSQQAETATKARAEADQNLSAAQAVFRELEKSWQDFNELEGARLCRQCGQPLTPRHFEEEKARREKELTGARAHCAEAANRQRQALQNEAHSKESVREWGDQLEQLREQFREAKNAGGQARKDAERLRTECAQVYRDLPEPLRLRVSSVPPADWLATDYPTAADVQQARQDARGLEAARLHLREAQDCHRQRCELQAKVATTRKSVAALEAELPGDLPALQQRYVELETDQATLDNRVKALREQERQAQADMDRLQKERENLQKQRGEREAALNAQEATRKHCRQAEAAALKSLPDAWAQAAEQIGLSELHSWQDEKETLEAKGAEARFRALEQARHGLEELRKQRDGLEAEAEAVPAEARRPLSEIQGLVRETRRLYEARDEAFRQAQQECLLLVNQKEQREALARQVLEVEREHNVLSQLTLLLGRDRLQLHLVRQAERQIIDHANAVLDRLSGGQLYLRLCGVEDGQGGTDEALELEAYNRTTGQQPINVAFLSGSQRFRVAVSLALGIGQYASRQHRPIESVIIDEGFGCLDRQARQVMIQELQNLRGQLRCILLVSHQEEFADAFNDGYHFALDNGFTKISRIQR